MRLLGCIGDRLTRILFRYMLANLEAFDTQGVSNCLYAFGLLRCSSGDRRRWCSYSHVSSCDDDGG